MGEFWHNLGLIWSNAAGALLHASADGWIQALFTLFGIVAATVTFAIQQAQANALQRKEVYQRLELASNELFRFEADHAAVISRFRDLVRVDAKFSAAERRVLDDPTAGEAVDAEPALREALASMAAQQIVASKCYEQTLNLFEMATRLRLAGILEPEVFGSWVAWFHDCLCEWAFREQWASAKANYTRDLRSVFDKPVASFDPNDDEVLRKQRFFNHVAAVFHCPVIRHWLDDIEEPAGAVRRGRRQEI